MSSEWLVEAIRNLHEIPVLQGTLVALCTFILEDPTTIGSGLLVADGWMSFPTAIIGLTSGIALGDLGLYGIGRFLGPKCVSRGWVSEESLEQARNWANRNLVTAIVAARFIPGTRFPTYVGAGIVRASAARFFMIAVTASLIWTLLLVTLTLKLGQAVLPLLGRWKWPIAIGFIVLIVSVQIVVSSRYRKRQEERMKDRAETGSWYEFLPAWLFYIPVIFYYLWLGLKYRSLTLPTCSNPSIYSGGMIRESKSEILSLISQRFSDYRLRFTTFTKPEKVTSQAHLLESALKSAAEVGISIPFVAKPDEGQRGAGVQLIRSREQLSEYLHCFPESVPILFQELAEYQNEAGAFYCRKPGEEKGTIISMTLKFHPSVHGDGKHTLRELIMADSRARRIRHVYFARHAKQLDRVLESGEEFRLVFAGNHVQGAIFKDGVDLITPALCDRFHEIAAEMPEYYFGRFDVRFRDIESFQRGENFKIIEANGASSEETHIWDPNGRLIDAYRTLFDQFRLVFEIGDLNRRRGHKPLTIRQFMRDVFDYLRNSRDYPATD